MISRAIWSRPSSTAQCRELAQVELARLVGLGVGHQGDVVGGQAGEGGVGGDDGGRPGAAGCQVVHVRSHEDTVAGVRASFHGPQDARTAHDRATVKPQTAAADISTSQGVNTSYLLTRA
jgi:hypothetical protein